MSEQSAPPPGEFGPWLSEQGADAYALVWVDPPGQPAGWPGGVEPELPRLGETGIARPGFDSARIVVQEVVYGREEALRRWLDLDTGARPLAIVTTGPDGLREHTPGELAVARLLHDTTRMRSASPGSSPTGSISAAPPPRRAQAWGGVPRRLPGPATCAP
ncbi:hypothetical protein [Streptomyces sp. CL12-4]|uniref:hypothetical protein n=1 Tax=Streptomyces sp. CL12-4 TaxID=2810306 RepID=UPI001EFA4399|nr:hypothetical protein [Streptomyces sp. CL12-4]